MRNILIALALSLAFLSQSYALSDNRNRDFSEKDVQDSHKDCVKAINGNLHYCCTIDENSKLFTIGNHNSKGDCVLPENKSK